MTDAQMFLFYVLKREMFIVKVRLRYFTMLCNDAEYKNMDQDESLGQLYDEQNWIKIYYKQSGWTYSFPTKFDNFHCPCYVDILERI
jgi:hypothetical protein